MFLQIPTLQELNGYGHEDTYWGIWFQQNQHQISYIDNPVLHLGLEDNQVFINKTMQALTNLKALAEIIDQKAFLKNVKLYKYYAIFKKYKLTFLVYNFSKPFNTFFNNNLLSSNPSMFIFNWVKLVSFIKLNMR